jgi:hypothetical protein
MPQHQFCDPKIQPDQESDDESNVRILTQKGVGQDPGLGKVVHAAQWT